MDNSYLFLPERMFREILVHTAHVVLSPTEQYVYCPVGFLHLLWRYSNMHARLFAISLKQFLSTLWIEIDETKI